MTILDFVVLDKKILIFRALISSQIDYAPIVVSPVSLLQKDIFESVSELLNSGKGALESNQVHLAKYLCTKVTGF